ncbi:Sodium-dependent serotonin transporter [Eumeta japonica]|uniref:Transporter n=1 Tax=Eumeta variegata TaxID=151549 RepID=A0A4C1VEY4_EUMVA|nr:Sodium-dependent serotonin transporter [Eumeta japonica]
MAHPPERWGSPAEYLLSCLGYAVGIGNVWRFPYLCYRNGGGAFLVPYFLTLLLCGIPLVYLETSLAQFANAGCISIFNINPLLKGAGYASIILNVIAIIYFSTLMAYPVLYMYHSFSSPLPWKHCGNPWNTDKCTEVVYFTVSFPYIVLLILFIRGITLPGAWQGIQFYTWPDWRQLTEPKVWADAATQLFFSLGPGWGGLVCMASFNKFHYNNLPSSVIIPLVNSGTSIWAGFVVFSVLGFAAERTGVSVGQVATAGPGLAFVTYPAAVSMMPAPNFWAFVFFIMLFFLGIDSMFVTIEGVIVGVVNEWPSLRVHKKKITFVTCLVLCACSIVCNTEGGLHILTLLDSHVSIACVPLVCGLEVAAAVYTYGADRLTADVSFMTGRPPHRMWIPLWKYINPIILIFITVYALREATGLAGWIVAMVSVVWIPVHAAKVLLKAKGSILQRFRNSCKPTSDWGPVDPEIRANWLALQREDHNGPSSFSMNDHHTIRENPDTTTSLNELNSKDQLF